MKGLLVLSLALFLAVPSVEARELPVPVESVQKLVLTPDYDDKYVTVDGYVTGVGLFLGRMDGKYFIVYVDKELALVFPEIIGLRTGDRVLVQGRFQKDGKVGGHFFKNFIREPRVY